MQAKRKDRLATRRSKLDEHSVLVGLAFVRRRTSGAKEPVARWLARPAEDGRGCRQKRRSKLDGERVVKVNVN